MAAGGPTDTSRARYPRWWIVAGLLALLLLAGLMVLWIKVPAMYGTGDAAKTATATTRAAILTVAAALIAATAAGAGLYFTARTVRVNQQTLLETRRANREADRRDRYAKAIEQLGHDKAPVRLGAMYSLERLAQDNLELRQVVGDVFCAYLRMPFKLPERYELAIKRMPFKLPKRYKLAFESWAGGTEDPSPADATDRESERNAVEELLVRQTAQRLLAAHLRCPPGTSGVEAQDIDASPEVTFWPGIGLDLTEASLVDLDLQEISVTHVLFGGAIFFGDARFSGATFSGSARFERATFSGSAWFNGATFSSDPVLDQVQVLHVDDPDLNRNREWPDGWTIGVDRDNRTYGTLIRQGSGP